MADRAVTAGKNEGGDLAVGYPSHQLGGTRLVHADCIEWLGALPAHSLHAIVTDPPYGVVEFSPKEQAKLRVGKGGIWRIPPKIGGSLRAPLPRFTVLTQAELEHLSDFFERFGRAALHAVVPGAHLMIATNPLVSTRLYAALAAAGWEPRGEIIRLVITMRGGDRPKLAEEEFPDVSVMPRAAFEPWGLFRAPLDGHVRDTLRTWGTGGLRRISDDQPFFDVVKSGRTPRRERDIADHPSLKPQHLMRQLVRASLPLGRGIVCDPFAGGGSTLAAAEAVGYESVGCEVDPHYLEIALAAIPRLARIPVDDGADAPPVPGEGDGPEKPDTGQLRMTL